MSLKRLDWMWLFGLGMAVNLLAAYFITQPNYMDAYYYFDGAVRLAHGQGFSEPYLWNYLDPALRLPHPSYLYWMPLTSLVAAPFVAVAERVAGSGASQALLFRAAQLPMVLAASVLPLLSYAAALLIARQRRHAVAAALMTIFSAFYLVFWAQTDAFAIYGVVAAAAMLAGFVGLRRSAGRWLFLAGLCAGLAHLARTDGVLILPVVLGMVIWDEVSRHKASAAGPQALHPSTAVYRRLLLVAAGYLVIMLPWMVRNFLVMGVPLAPGGTRMLWLTDYNDLFSYPANSLTLTRYLAAGWAAILNAKWSALAINSGNVLAALGDIVAFPFMLAGFWVLRRHPLYVAALVYGICLFGLMTLAFSFQGARGGFFHSATALLPFVSPAAVIGLDAAVEATARGLEALAACKVQTDFCGIAGGVRGRGNRPCFSAASVGRRLASSAFEPGRYRLWRDRPMARDDGAGGRGSGCEQPAGFLLLHRAHKCGYSKRRARRAAPCRARLWGSWVVLDANLPEGLRALYAQPSGQPDLNLRHTFADAAGRPVYLLEVEK